MSLNEIENFTSLKQCPLCGQPRFWQPRLIAHRLGEYAVHHVQTNRIGGIVFWIGVTWIDPCTRAEPMRKICVHPRQFVQEITGQMTNGMRIA